MAYSAPNIQSDGKMEGQAQPRARFPLLSLPPEIRHEIWRKVLGGNLIHILHAPHKLVGVVCTERDDGYEHTRCHSCWDLGEKPRPQGFSFARSLLRRRPSNSNSKSTGLLQLPLTCRAVHDEAMPILYNDNTFDLNHAAAVIRFQRSLVASSMPEIRDLQLTWDNLVFGGSTPNDLDTWSQACEALPRFTGLEKLTVRIGMHSHSRDNISRWESSIQPLVCIDGPEQFDVILSSFDGELADEVKLRSYPFRLLGEMRYFPP